MYKTLHAPHSRAGDLLSSWHCIPWAAVFAKRLQPPQEEISSWWGSDSGGCPTAAERIKWEDQLLRTESAPCNLSGLLWVNKDSSVNSRESEPQGGVNVTCRNWASNTPNIALTVNRWEHWGQRRWPIKGWRSKNLYLHSVFDDH